jgi:oligosaccharide repeat unit polymerase
MMGAGVPLTLAVAAGMTSLAVLAYAYWRSVFAPAVIYAAYWAFVVAFSGMLRIGDSTLSPRALLVFVIGAVCFVGGSAICTVLYEGRGERPISPMWEATPERKRAVQIAVLVYSIVLAALIPSFIATVRTAGELLGIDDFAMAARGALSLADRGGVSHYFQSATSLGAIFAFYAAWLYKGGWRDMITLAVASAAALAMSALTFARSPVVSLMLGLLAILSLRGTVKPRTVLLFGLATVVLAIGLGVMLDKGPEVGTGKSAGLALAENLGLYFVGGPLGFSMVQGDPIVVGEPWLSLRFIIQIGSWLGLSVPHFQTLGVLDYVTSDLGNVYTFYYPFWLDGQWLGVIGASLLAGMVCTLAYLAARRGHPVAGAAFGLVLGGIAGSAIGDALFYSPTPWMLSAGLGLVLWKLPTRWPWRRARAHAPSVVPLAGTY